MSGIGFYRDSDGKYICDGRGNNSGSYVPYMLAAELVRVLEWIDQPDAPIGSHAEFVRKIEDRTRAALLKWREFDRHDSRKLKDALIHIAEYWNGSENETAMADACHHVADVARQALEGTWKP